MTRDEEHCYGPKLNRLLRINKMDSLSGLVLPTFPIPPMASSLTTDSAEVDDPVSAYALLLTQAFPQLARDCSVRSDKIVPLPAAFDPDRYFPREDKNRRLVVRAACALKTKEISPPATRPTPAPGSCCQRPPPGFQQSVATIPR